jgi:polyhydroxyalkanoate synthesis regulator phasin
MEKLGSGLKKVLLAGIGAVAVTGEKSKELLDEMVKKGELTVEQGKVLNEELKHNIKSTVKEKVNVKVKTSSPEELDELLDKMTPEQMALLKQRIDEMEKKQEEFEAAETVEDVADESVCEDAAEKAAEEETAENEDI